MHRTYLPIIAPWYRSSSTHDHRRSTYSIEKIIVDVNKNIPYQSDCGATNRHQHLPHGYVSHMNDRHTSTYLAWTRQAP